MRWLVLFLLLSAPALATQTEDGSTVGVILNRPTARKHEQTGEILYFGGPVMREVQVALFRAERAPQAAAFHVLYGGFAGWAPGQLQSEMQRGGWYVLPASVELAFRKDTAGMWEEMVRKARGRVALG